MLPQETKQSGCKPLTLTDLRGCGGGVFLGEMSSSRCYSKKDCKEKKNQQHSHRFGTWNVRTLNRGGKLRNLKKEFQKNEVTVLGVSEVR